MSVIIRGLNLPAEPMILILHPDGNISTEDYEIGANAKAIELPTHGRLIDGDKVMAALSDMAKEYPKNPLDSIGGYMIFKVRGAIEKLPTIIGAEASE